MWKKFWRVDTVQKNHSAESHSAESHSTEKPQCRKTVQNGRSAEMGNVPIVLSSRVTEGHEVTT